MWTSTRKRDLQRLNRSNTQGGGNGNGNGRYRTSPPDKEDRPAFRTIVHPDNENEHWVDSHLRRAYGDIAAEPLPETFQALLRRLRGNENGSGGETTD